MQRSRPNAKKRPPSRLGNCLLPAAARDDRRAHRSTSADLTTPAPDRPEAQLVAEREPEREPRARPPWRYRKRPGDFVEVRLAAHGLTYRGYATIRLSRYQADVWARVEGGVSLALLLGPERVPGAGRTTPRARSARGRCSRTRRSRSRDPDPPPHRRDEGAALASGSAIGHECW